MTQGRDSSGRFAPGAVAAAVGTKTKNQSNVEVVEATAAASDPVLEQHQTGLASVRADYDKLVTLSGKGAALSDELGRVEHSIEGIAERLLSDGVDPELEQELAGLDTRLTSLRAQAELSTRVQRTAETVLQKRLPADITACERLYRHWLSYVEERETEELLAAVSDGELGKPDVQAAARTLAIAWKTYCRTVSELGEGAAISYAWTRDLNPVASEKSAASQNIGTVTAPRPLLMGRLLS
jgi:hypothetical protein